MEILLLSREDCGFCNQAKEALDRLAEEHPLTVRILDFDSNEGQGLALRAGMLFPPGVFLDNQPFSYGRLSERKLRREIERHLSPSIEGVDA